MTTLPSVASTPMAGSKHALGCQAAFVRTVLPHFPEAKPRFERYFLESYSLIRSLPKDGEFPSGLALTLLGIKGFDAFLPPVSGAILERTIAVDAAGLGYRIRSNTYTFSTSVVELYDPGLVITALSNALGKEVLPGGIQHHLQIFENRNSLCPGKYPYSLLSWPSLIEAGRGSQPPLAIEIKTGRYAVTCASAKDNAARAMTAIIAALALVDEMRTGESVPTA